MKPLVSDALWERLHPLLPPSPPRRFRHPGRKPLDYRKILTGILFVLKTGIAWDDLPAELGCGCGKTCRHYLRAWHQAGVVGLRTRAAAHTRACLSIEKLWTVVWLFQITSSPQYGDGAAGGVAAELGVCGSRMHDSRTSRTEPLLRPALKSAAALRAWKVSRAM